MSVQANINQSLSLMGLLFSQTPLAEKARANAQRQHAIDTAKQNVGLAQGAENEALEAYTDMIENTTRTGKEKGLTGAQIDVSILETPEHEVYKETMSAETKAHEELTKLEPTQENIKGVINRRRAEKEQEEIDTRARETLAKEQQRLARSREITRMITEGIPLSPNSQDYVNKRLGGTK